MSVTCLHFRNWMDLVAAQLPGGLPPERRREYGELVADTCGVWDSGPWAAVPGIVHRIFAPRGWAWNGIYVLTGPRRLELAAGAGPPVCHTIEKSGGLHSSGMCFDALMMNQTVVASDVAAWPGYVSCDAESGLRTVAGMACPIRGEGGSWVAVWDLDALEPLEPWDGLLMDRFFAALAAARPPAPQDFRG